MDRHFKPVRFIVEKENLNLVNATLLIVFNILMVLMALMILVYSLLPVRIIEFKDKLFPVLNKGKVLKAGETLRYEVNYCKYTDNISITSRVLICDMQFGIAIGTIGRSKGCHKITMYIPIPRDIPPSVCYLKDINQYHISPLKIVTVEHNTEYFKVIN